MKAMILGYKGFLGSHLQKIEEIRKMELILPSRIFSKTEKRANEIFVPFEKAWETAGKERPEMIINLIGVLKETYKGEYEKAHVQTAAEIASYCLSNPSTKVVQISAIGPQSCPSAPYFKTKREAEKIIMQSSKNAVILRPGIIFGEGQKVFSQIRTMSVFSPVLFCPDIKTALVSAARIAGLIHKAAAGAINPGIYEVYDEISDMKTFFQRALDFMGIKRKVISLPKKFFWPAAAAGDFLPFIPINLAQYKMLSCQALPCGLYPRL